MQFSLGRRYLFLAEDLTYGINPNAHWDQSAVAKMVRESNPLPHCPEPCGVPIYTLGVTYVQPSDVLVLRDWHALDVSQYLFGVLC